MGGIRAHYRVCKEFANVAYCYYQLDDLIGAIDVTGHVDSDDVDEIFRLASKVEDAAVEFTLALQILDVSDGIDPGVKENARFLTGIVRHWAEKGRMTDSAFRNLLLSQERDNSDDVLDVLNRMVDGADEDELKEVFEGPDESELDSEEGEPAPVENVREIGGEGPDGQTDAGDADSDDDWAIFTHPEQSSDEWVSVSPDDAPSDEEDSAEEDSDDDEMEVVTADVADEVPSEGPEHADEAGERRYTLEELKRIITNQDPIPAEIVGEVSDYYAQRESEPAKPKRARTARSGRKPRTTAAKSAARKTTRRRKAPVEDGGDGDDE